MAAELRLRYPAAETFARRHGADAVVVLHNLVAHARLRNGCLVVEARWPRRPRSPPSPPPSSPRYRALVLTAAYAGCRWGELAGLLRRNVDLDRRTIAVVEQVVELRSGKLLRCDPKSAAGRRVVHLPDGVLAELKAYVATSSEQGDDGMVFPGPNGGGLRSTTSTIALALRHPGRRRRGPPLPRPPPRGRDPRHRLGRHHPLEMDRQTGSGGSPSASGA